jgi:hypothetical protein
MTLPASSTASRAARQCRPTVTLALAGIVFCTILACSPDDVTRSPSDLYSGEPQLLMTSASCAVNYRTIITTSDPDLASVGIPVQTDTSQVCERWTGSDYQIQETLLGGTMTEGDVPDTNRIIEYTSGAVVGYTANGVATSDPAVVPGGTLGDLVAATPAEKAAAVDDPYDAIIASGSQCTDPPGVGCNSGGSGGGGEECDQAEDCCPPEERVCEDGGLAGIVAARFAAQLSAGLPAVDGATRPDDGKYRKHGLTRRGVRALLESYNRVGSSSEGWHRFRGAALGGEEIVDVDPRTELIVRQ